MFKAAIDTNRIVVTNPDKEIITSGSVNVNFIRFSFSEDWVDLQKTVLFQTKKAQIPIILEGTELVYTMPIPWEVCLYANESINVGAYGTRMDDSETLEDEEIVLPTIWGTIPDKIRQGVIVTDPTPSSPTYNAYQLLLKTIADIIASGGGGGGLPGISPTISVEETDNGVVLTIVDVNGERSVTITNGIDGISPTISVIDIEGGKRLIITDINGEHVFDILDGKDGSAGVTFTPSVSPDGELSWDNDGGLENPDPVNIKGPKGDSGNTPFIGENGNWWIGETDTGVTATGPAGDPGEPGVDGKSAYQIAVDNGFDGTEQEWLESLKGSGSGETQDWMGNVYSTEETRIGTWIDGKPLYRRVIEYVVPSSVPLKTSIDTGVSIGNACRVCNMIGGLASNGTPLYTSLNGWGDEGGCWVDDTTGMIGFSITKNESRGRTAIFIVEYTKTVD